MFTLSAFNEPHDLKIPSKCEEMKITRIEFWKVVVPMREDTTYSSEYLEMEERPRFWDIPKHIVRLHTDDSSVVGIGETGWPANLARRTDRTQVGNW